MKYCSKPTDLRIVQRGRSVVRFVGVSGTRTYEEKRASLLKEFSLFCEVRQPLLVSINYTSPVRCIVVIDIIHALTSRPAHGKDFHAVLSVALNKLVCSIGCRRVAGRRSISGWSGLLIKSGRHSLR